MKKVYVVSDMYGVVGVASNMKRAFDGVTRLLEMMEEEGYIDFVVGTYEDYTVKRLKVTYPNFTKVLKEGYSITILTDENENSIKVELKYLNAI